MDAQHWQHADRIFQAALEREPSARAAFLDEACSGDQKLRSQVEALLSSDEQGWDLLERPAFEGAVGLLAEDQPNLLEGEQIGQYKVLGLLGTGGMGEVYLAEDSSLGRKIALKVLPATFVKYKNRIARFQQEARAASALNHPNIVTIHEISQFEGRHFIAIEFIEGETLRQRVSRGKLDVGEALDIAIQVASALAAAHRAGIVHRDIKPENIMLRTDGYVKILDFGLAKLTEQPETVGEIEEQTEGQASISSGLLMGTVRYMSPEQASGLKVDARSDIFSFGVVLHEMLTGHRPFEGETNQELLDEILKKQPPMDFVEDASSEQKQILLRTLSKDRGERYQTVDDLLLDLKRLKRSLELEIGAQGYNLPRSTAGHPPIGGADAMLPLPISGVSALMSSIKRRKATAFTAALLLVGATAILYGLYHFAGRGNAAARFQIQELKQLTTSGKARDAAISPDGKYVAYVSEDERGQSIWLRQIDTTTTTELVSGSRERLAALTFSPDGDRIFFVRYDDEEQTRNALCEISVLGGPTQRLISAVHSPISFSPDGKRFAFFRRYEIQSENALMLANIDGTGEQELGRRRRPERFSDYPCGPAWSPDGTLIAYGVRVGTRTVINVIGPDNRAEKTIAAEDRGGIYSLAWLSDVSGIIITAPERVGSARAQLWMVSYPSGESRRITNDLVFHVRASVATKSDVMVIEQIVPVAFNSNLWLVQDGDASKAKQITTDAGRYKPSWTPDGKLIYSLSAASSGTHIYGIEADGSQKRRVTSGPASYFGANVSPDGRYIAFVSTDREEGEGIYIMDMDGSNLRRLVGAQLLGGFEFSWSPDSKCVVYRGGTGPENSSPEAIWKVSIEGGDAIQLTDFSFIRSPTVSPDGKLIACFYRSLKENPQSGFALIPFEGGAPVKRFAMNPGRVSGWCQWTRDGRALMYVDTQGGVSNIWSQPIDGGPPRKLTDFISDQIGHFQWSPDGKQLACSRGSDKRDVILLKHR